MASFGDAVKAVQSSPGGLAETLSSVDINLVKEALDLTGTQSIRRRKLPAAQVVWLILGMALFVDSSIENVCNRLGLSLGGNVSKAGASKARAKLGWLPIARLFELICSSWSKEEPSQSFHGLQVLAIDGTDVRVPDSDENYSFFGKHGSQKGETAYPKARIVLAVNTSSRLLHSAQIGPLSISENEMAGPLIRDLPEDTVCLLDRGYVGFERFWRIPNDKPNRHYICRVRDNVDFIGRQQLPDGTTLGIIQPSSAVRKKNPSMPRQIPVRIVEYIIDGHAPVRLFTSLLDHEKFSGREVAELYHERWEVELSFKEIKVELFERREALRSRKPDGVLQEIWGSLLMYNLIRRQMYFVAKEYGSSPTQISFKNSCTLIYCFFQGHADDPAVGRLPQRLRDLSEEIWRLRLPARRSHRRFPRVVKIKMSPYLRKPPRPRLSTQKP